MSRKFNTEDWYNPLTWFGQPSEAPPKFDGVTQFSDGVSDFKPATSGNTFNDALKNEFVQPFQRGEKSVVNTADDVLKIGRDIEKDIGTLSDGVITTFNKTENLFEDFGTGVKNFFINDIEPVGKDIYKILRASLNGGIWITENYKLVGFGVGSYFLLDYVNKLKTLNA